MSCNIHIAHWPRRGPKRDEKDRQWSWFLLCFGGKFVLKRRDKNHQLHSRSFSSLLGSLLHQCDSNLGSLRGHKHAPLLNKIIHINLQNNIRQALTRPVTNEDGIDFISISKKDRFWEMSCQTNCLKLYLTELLPIVYGSSSWATKSKQRMR